MFAIQLQYFNHQQVRISMKTLGHFKMPKEISNKPFRSLHHPVDVLHWHIALDLIFTA